MTKYLIHCSSMSVSCLTSLRSKTRSNEDSPLGCVVMSFDSIEFLFFVCLIFVLSCWNMQASPRLHVPLTNLLQSCGRLGRAAQGGGLSLLFLDVTSSTSPSFTTSVFCCEMEASIIVSPSSFREAGVSEVASVFWLLGCLRLFPQYFCCKGPPLDCCSTSVTRAPDLSLCSSSCAFRRKFAFDGQFIHLSLLHCCTCKGSVPIRTQNVCPSTFTSSKPPLMCCCCWVVTFSEQLSPCSTSSFLSSNCG